MSPTSFINFPEACLNHHNISPLTLPEVSLSANTLVFPTSHRERNINYFVAPVERGTQFLTPPIERTVKRIDAKLPLEKAARTVDRRIKKGIDRYASPKQ